MIDQFLNKVRSGNATIGVIGIGYVGLPLCREFVRGGAKVIGFDVDSKKVEAIENKKTYIKHIPDETIAQMVESGLLEATTDFNRLEEPDAILIAVPTPLDKMRQPDLSYVEKSCVQIAKRLREGQLVVLESTTYPGTSKEVMLPILEENVNGLKVGYDYFLAYSPEREDPGREDYSTKTIPKVVGGYDENSLEAAKAIYSIAIDTLVPVSSCEVAEASKILENTYRCVNIALVNELKMLFDRMGINVWEVIEASSTKPFGFTPFYPGPGLGGHCIPIDPFYLSWKAKEYEMPTRFIELAGEVNCSMPEWVVHKVMEALNEQGKALKGSKILIVGLAYKPNVDDDRESPSYKLWDLLEKHGAIVGYYDPFIPAVRSSREYFKYAGIKSVEMSKEIISSFDCVLISTRHDCIDHNFLAHNCKLLIDTRNSFHRFQYTKNQVINA